MYRIHEIRIKLPSRMCTKNLEIVSVKVIIMQVCSYNDQNIVKIKMYELIENENLKKING